MSTNFVIMGTKCAAHLQSRPNKKSHLASETEGLILTVFRIIIMLIFAFCMLCDFFMSQNNQSSISSICTR